MLRFCNHAFSGLVAGAGHDLTAREFTLLTLLLRRQGQILSHMMLAEQVESDVITTAVFRFVI